MAKQALQEIVILPALRPEVIITYMHFASVHSLSFFHIYIERFFTSHHSALHWPQSSSARLAFIRASWKWENHAGKFFPTLQASLFTSSCCKICRLRMICFARVSSAESQPVFPLTRPKQSQRSPTPRSSTSALLV